MTDDKCATRYGFDFIKADVVDWIGRALTDIGPLRE